MRPMHWVRGQRGASAAVACLALVALAPLLILLARGIAALPADVRVSGDPAVTELYTLRASRGEQWLGPYSRFGFHHPGPLLFYLFAPFYLLLGKSYAALCIAALVVNLASLAGIAHIVLRTAGAPRALWALAALAAYLAYLGPELLVSAWNPDVAVIPLALTLVALAAAMAGFTGCLPLAALAGSLAVQSHLTAAAPLAAAGLLTAIALVVGRRRGAAREAGEKRPFARHIMLTGMVLAVVWAPPVIEQLRDTPGNGTLIIRYLLQRHDGQTVGTAISAVATQASGFLLSPLGVTGQVLPGGSLGVAAKSLTLLQLVVLLVGAWRGWARRDRFVAAACGSAALLLGAAVLVTLGISGPLWPYLTRWVSAVGVFGWIAVAAAFTGREWGSPRRARVQLVACATLVCTYAVAGSREVARFPSLGAYVASAWPDRLSQRTIDGLSARGVRRPHLRILDNQSWEQAAAIVLQCEKTGRPITVDSDWLFMFGERFRLREADDGAILVARSDLAARLAGQPGTEELASGGGDAALLAAHGTAVPGPLQIGSLAAEAWLRGGFSGAEADAGGGFRWSDAPASLLRLPGSPDTAAALRFEASSVEVPGARQELTVELNGVRVGVLAMRRGWATYSVAVAADAVREENLVTFRYSLVRSPHELSRSQDRRRLAVRFRWIALGGSPARTAAGVPADVALASGRPGYRLLETGT